MKVLLISTSVYEIPLKGYGGLEQLCWCLAEGLHKKGHTVAVVAPQGSKLSEGIELIPTVLREEEEAVWPRYRERLGEFNVILDASWQRWASLTSAQSDPQLPVVNWHHTDPSVYGGNPPVQYPMWVGLSRDHAERLSRHHNTPVKFVYNGIDTQFYVSNGKPRGNRYLWLARWTPEKAGAEIIDLAQRLRIGVDMFGDTEIIGSQDYVRLCLSRADGFFARAMSGIPREETVNAYSTHAGLLQWYNWFEPFGLNLVEAMACGCVPIVQRRGAAAELIRDGQTGFLVDTIEEMGERIRSDAIKKIEPEVMRKFVEKRFGVERFVSDWETLLQKVVAGERW